MSNEQFSPDQRRRSGQGRGMGSDQGQDRGAGRGQGRGLGRGIGGGQGQGMGQGRGLGQGRGAGAGQGRGPGQERPDVTRQGERAPDNDRGITPGPRAAKGRGFGGAGLDPERRAQHEKDQKEFQTLLARHQQLHRELECRPDGIRAVTTSDAPELVPLIQHHVRRMHQRMLENWPVRRWDTLYIEIFKHRDEIRMDIRDLDNGIEVEETSDNPRVARLLHAHGKTVSAFVERGFDAARHPAPVPEDYVID